MHKNTYNTTLQVIRRLGVGGCRGVRDACSQMFVHVHAVSPNKQFSRLHAATMRYVINDNVASIVQATIFIINHECVKSNIGDRG